MLRLVDDIVVVFGGAAGQVPRKDGSLRVILHAEAAVLLRASGRAPLVVLSLLGRLI